jgi:adenylate cyclase
VALYSTQEAAERAGVDTDYVGRLIDGGLLGSAARDLLSAGDVRRILFLKSLDDAGLPLEGVAAAMASGAISLDFMDAPAYERYAALSSETFAQVSERTGIPFELLAVIRESIGLEEPSPGDRLSDNELAIVPFIELQVVHGFRTKSIERLLRVGGEATRRIAESEAAWWYAEVMFPNMESADAPEDPGFAKFANQSTPLAEQSVLAMYHLQQARAWTANMINGFEATLENAGLHSRLERPPAICFLDITGYTRLTQERGDDAAAELAAKLARLVERSSVRHGGKPIKWLGDGVMFHFRDPAQGVRAALEMVAGMAPAELPPAHVGLHTGPVIFQGGDYFGQTVNISARIAEYARPGEVLVSQAVADASRDQGIAFQDIGPVELKGVGSTTHVLRAHVA